jgi:HD superfamily phosphohydrolase
MLWSRYQLYTQVLNHKTNVMLNALLAQALPEAVQSASVPLGRPKYWEEFLEFTDDFVMSRVVSLSLRQQRNSVYKRALVERKLPRYLGCVDLVVDEPEDRRKSFVEAEKRRVAERAGVSPGHVQCWYTSTTISKRGLLPYVARRDRARSTDEFVPPGAGAYRMNDWVQKGNLPPKIDQAHFFVDRHVES